MNAMKSLLAVSVSAMAATGAAHAATVGTFGTVSVMGIVVGTLPPAFGSLKVNGTIAGSGTAILDDVGKLVVTDSQVATTSVGGAPATSNTADNISNFTGTYASSVFTGAAGTSFPICIGTCPLIVVTNTYLTVVGTVAVPPGGTLVTTLGEFGGAVTGTETWTFSGFTPVSSVPLPPAAWLLGSALAGLVGTARRRRMTKA